MIRGLAILCSYTVYRSIGSESRAGNAEHHPERRLERLEETAGADRVAPARSLGDAHGDDQGVGTLAVTSVPVMKAWRISRPHSALWNPS